VHIVTYITHRLRISLRKNINFRVFIGVFCVGYMVLFLFVASRRNFSLYCYQSYVAMLSHVKLLLLVSPLQRSSIFRTYIKHYSGRANGLSLWGASLTALCKWMIWKIKGAIKKDHKHLFRKNYTLFLFILSLLYGICMGARVAIQESDIRIECNALVQQRV